jgi:ribonucleoside-diphosphate reductase beta chain
MAFNQQITANKNTDNQEEILKENKARFTLFPIKYKDIFQLYKNSLASFWTVEEIDFSADITDWETKLNDKERYFIKNVLAFFAASDGIVNENLVTSFYNEIQIPEARNLYATQIQIEAIHSECVTKDTMVYTDSGFHEIGDLSGVVTNVWNGYNWSEVLIENTGVKEIFVVKLSNGLELRCSGGHEWVLPGNKKVATKFLEKGQELNSWWSYPSLGHSEDHSDVMACPYYHGNLNRKEKVSFVKKTINGIKVMFTFTKDSVVDKPIDYVPTNCNNSTKVLWIAGLIDSDISRIYNSFDFSINVLITSKNEKFIKLVQLLLHSLNVKCITGMSSRDGKFKLRINQHSLIKLKNLGMITVTRLNIVKYNVDNIDDDTFSKLTVKSVRNTNISQDTFCFHEEKNHTGVFNGILTGQCYSLLIDTYIKDTKEKEDIFNSAETNPIVKKKADWAMKWINSDASFAERILAFGAVEGVFFSGSFCSIFWLKSRGLMPGLAMSNQFISRDEAMHCQTCVLLYSKLKYKLPESRVHEIFREAYEIEEEFITKSLPVSLIGMNSESMKEYIKYVVDYWLTQLGYSTLYNTKNPFPFMNYISLENKTNFFEKRVSEYSKANFSSNKEENMFNMDEDF